MFNLDEFLTVSFTLFAVIDILGGIPVLISLKDKMGHIDSGKATITAGFLMILFLVIGEKFLHIIGIDVKSFAVAGSIVIFILGLEMVLGLEFFKEDSDGTKTGSIIPIAFPIIAGSGTLTTIMSLKASFGFYNILAAIIVNLLVIFAVLKSLKFLERILGKEGLNVLRKFFGVVLLAIAVKIFKGSYGGA